MGLLDIIKEDIEAITSDGDGFARSITMTAPTLETVTFNGLHSKHHLGFDSESGRDVNTKNAHIAVSEKFLTDANYPVRNAAGEVDLKNHKVRVEDSTGVEWTYKVEQWFPDETIGLIVCILGNFKVA